MARAIGSPTPTPPNGGLPLPLWRGVNTQGWLKRKNAKATPLACYEQPLVMNSRAQKPHSAFLHQQNRGSVPCFYITNIERKTINCANCHNENTPTATTKTRQLPQRKRANCHNKNAPTATTEGKTAMFWLINSSPFVLHLISFSRPMAAAFFTFLPFYLFTFKTPVENPFHNLWKTFPLSTHFTTRLLSTMRAVDIQHEINML